MAEAGKTETNTEGEFISTTFDSFSITEQFEATVFNQKRLLYCT